MLQFMVRDQIRQPFGGQALHDCPPTHPSCSLFCILPPASTNSKMAQQDVSFKGELGEENRRNR